MGTTEKLGDYVTITNAKLWNHMVQTALVKLFKCDSYEQPKTLYWITKLEKEISEHTKEQSSILNKMRAKYIEKGEDGKAVIKDQEAWSKFEDEFNAVTVQTKVFKLKLEDLAGCKLAPSDINLLEDIISID